MTATAHAQDKLGLIAGGGALPIVLADHCRNTGRAYWVLRLRGFADAALNDHPGGDYGLAELGGQIQALKKAGCLSICFAGNVQRPDFGKLKPDLRGLRSFPGAISAAARGDDALLRFLMAEFEKDGFHVEGAHDVGIETLAAGPLGALQPASAHKEDIDLALKAARTLGGLDIGQAVAVARGVVLAVEAQEGTDGLLKRCAELPANLRGEAGHRVGVLVKWPKSIQDRRVDMPTLGLKTVIGAAEAGLAGIVAQAGGALIIDRQAIVDAADRLGLFVFGLEAAD